MRDLIEQLQQELFGFGKRPKDIHPAMRKKKAREMARSRPYTRSAKYGKKLGTQHLAARSRLAQMKMKARAKKRGTQHG